MEKAYQLSWLERDALREITSIGAGNASAAFSNLVNKEINLITPSIDVVPIKKIPEFIGGPKKMIIGSYTPVAGDLTGNMLAIFLKKDALMIIDLILRKQLGTTKQIGKQEQGAINQLMQSFSTTYLGAMEEFLEIHTNKANPRFISTFGENIIDFITLNIGKEEEIFLLKTEFGVKPNIKGRFLLVLAIHSVETLIELLKEKMKE